MPNSSTNETRQIRFAVVMYGGGSLAIYINGIAQELLKMARATAVDRLPGEEFTETEKVYRRIALLLSDELLLKQISGLRDEKQVKLVLESLLNKNREELKIEHPRLFDEVTENSRRRITSVPKEEQDTTDIKNIIETALKLNQPQARFIVDVISGSSAGGINGVFLAKALVNNQKIDDLKQLWLREGAFEKLLNDKKSIAGTELENSAQPRSLLNSRRMYLKLLDALDGMDKAKKADDESPNVEELDLYVTVTDYTGVPVTIRLFDRIVRERRHKQFFHFRYKKNNTAPRQFSRDYNPFLAFAARCTSAFPLAFEPMRLSDIDEVIESCKPEYRKRKSDAPEWKQFFEPFNLRKRETPEARYFLDGGALDNKPFGFALETLLERQADVPVDRKLIYIEPSPEFINQEGDILKKPDAAENLIAQGSTLPRYETIRKDLQILLERNRLVNRVNHLIKNAERDIDALRVNLKTKNPKTEQPQTSAGWEKLGLEDIVKLKGLGVLPYYRLRVVLLTDDIARMVTKLIRLNEDSELIRINEDSDYFLAIRNLVRYWREEKYDDYRNEKSSTINEFLRRFDLNYRIRRLRFVLQKAEQLARLDPETLEQIQKRAETEKTIRENKEIKRQQVPLSEAQSLTVSTDDGVIQLTPSEVITQEISAKSESKYLENKKRLSALARFFQKEINRIYKDFQEKQSLLKTAPTDENEAENPQLRIAQKYFIKSIAAIKLNSDDLKYLLGYEEKSGSQITASEFEGEEGYSRAADFLENRKPAVKPQIGYAAQKLENLYEIGFFNSVRIEIEKLLKQSWRPTAEQETELTPLGGESNLFRAVRAYLWHYYKNFDDYDQISFPIFYQTKVGEADTVDIIRISPHDAKSLIDEEDGSDGRRKLAGGALFGFGAFLDVAWRQNDIMWGRLDGAERLITALLPAGAEYYLLRKVLVEEAHSIILKEEFLMHNTENLAALYSEVLLKTSAGIEAKEAVRQAVSPINNLTNGDLRPVIRACLKDPKIRAVLAEHLSAKWEKRGKVPTAAVEAALDSAEVHKAIHKYFESNASTGAVAAITHQMSSQTLRQNVQTCLDEQAVIGFMQSFYQVNRRLEPQPLLRVISRSTQVIGKILEGISEKHAARQNQLQWIARLGQVFWGLVEVAAPNSLFNLLFRHWLKLLYFFQVILILGATLLVKPEVQQFGIVTLILTLAVHVTVLFLGDLMRGRTVWRNFLLGVGGTFLAISAVSGVLFLLSFFLFGELWMTFNEMQESYAGFSKEHPWVRVLPALLIALVVITLLVRKEKWRRDSVE